MQQTLVEKILSSKAGCPVKAGNEKLFEPDVIVAYDYPGYIDVYDKQMQELGITRVRKPEKYQFFIDHFYPSGKPNEVAIHNHTREFAARLGCPISEGKGVGHQVLAEMGRVLPGSMVVHFDGHVSTVGALGAFAIGIRNSMIEVLATQEVSLVVPETVRVEFSGSLKSGVGARDVYNTLLMNMGPAGARACILEYGGPGLKNLDLDDRFTLCNLAMFMGAVSAISEPDQAVLSFLAAHGQPEAKPVMPDAGATYQKTISLDLGSVEPVVGVHPSPANVHPLNDYLDVPIQSGLIGSCASGRITDFREAAAILKGKRIQPGFRLHVVPSSVEIQRRMAREGYLDILAEAGAQVHFPSCDFCVGMLGALTDGESAVSTGTLNIPGRMGSEKSFIYTVSPATVAATALTGKLTDPREFL